VNSISVVTVCMNRREHLLVTAAKVAAWACHGEHLIVDWGSREPLRREDLPADPRLRLLRVEGEKRWNLCRAYNFAIAQAGGTAILKLDADCWPAADFDPEQLLAEGPVWMGAEGEGRLGQFLMARERFEALGGFNEYLRGWGFDDKDLRGRLACQAGVPLRPIPAGWIGVIPHSNEERTGRGRAGVWQPLLASEGLAAMRASRLGNRLLAAHYPWGALTPSSHYQELAPGLWRVDPTTVPQPSPEIADEIDHARRMAFWSCFLAIPEIFLEELPVKLVPPSRSGAWPVRWWHRLWWHTGRRLLQLPVLALSLTRGQLEGARRALRRA
jgi:hypothetical protein